MRPEKPAAPSDVSTWGQIRGAWGFPQVAGRCPSCGTASLFLAVGGHVTCSVIGCADPCAVDDWLRNDPRRDCEFNRGGICTCGREALARAEARDA